MRPRWPRHDEAELNGLAPRSLREPEGLHALVARMARVVVGLDLHPVDHSLSAPPAHTNVCSHRVRTPRWAAPKLGRYAWDASRWISPEEAVPGRLVARRSALDRETVVRIHPGQLTKPRQGFGLVRASAPRGPCPGPRAAPSPHPRRRQHPPPAASSRAPAPPSARPSARPPPSRPSRRRP